MLFKYDIKKIVKMLEVAASSKARKERKFNEEYLIPNVTETNLLDTGFVFAGYSQGNICPTYRMGNIYALFDDMVLHVMEDSNY